MTPIATRTHSASTVSVFVLSAACASVTFAPFAVLSIAVVIVPTLNSMPCLVNARIAAAEMSSSSFGRMRSSISTTVTLVPKALKKYANSMPIAPEPMMTIDFGCFAIVRASKLERMVFPSDFANGSSLGAAPVAIITRSAVISATFSPPVPW